MVTFVILQPQNPIYFSVILWGSRTWLLYSRKLIQGFSIKWNTNACHITKCTGDAKLTEWRVFVSIGSTDSQVWINCCVFWEFVLVNGEHRFFPLCLAPYVFPYNLSNFCFPAADASQEHDASSFTVSLVFTLMCSIGIFFSLTKNRTAVFWTGGNI